MSAAARRTSSSGGRSSSSAVGSGSGCHVRAETARVLPVTEWVAHGRAAELLIVVHGAHAPGRLDLDVTALGADAYLGNCHTWPLHRRKRTP